MGSRVLRIVLVASAVAAMIPLSTPASAGCSPRTFSELGPAPSDTPPPSPPSGGEQIHPSTAPSDATTTTTTAPGPAESTTTTTSGPVETTTTTGTPPQTTTTTAPGPAESTTTTAPAEPPEPDITEEPAPEPGPRTPPPPRCDFYYRMEFPVVGGGRVGSGFGAIRDGGDRWHAGVDIEAPKMTPVVAVRAGTIQAINDRPGDCCWVVLRHTDGWQSYYIHLNNDTFGTDDGLGIGVRPGLVVGMRVEQGELIGWVGDSGNAETAVPHLHFELRTPWGEAVDPGPSLWAALRRLPSSFAEADDLRGRPLFIGAFADDDDHPLAAAIDAATTLGLSLDCDPWGLRFCPTSPATRTTAVSWIESLRGGVPVPADLRVSSVPVADLSGPLTSDVLTRVLAVPECVEPRLCGPPVTRGEAAELVHAALYQGMWATPDRALARLHAEGRVDQCAGMSQPVAGETLTRAGLLHMLLRAFGYLPTPPCGLIS